MNKVFQYQQSDIYYRVEGNGKAVVFIHGFGENGSIWNNQVNYLKDYCKVIVPDLPGSGLSPMIKGQTTIEAYAETIYALLQHEQVEKCIMLGHSMGGYITLSFAEKFPKLLTGFGLVHSTAFPDTEEKKTNRIRGIEIMKEYGAYSFLKNTIPNLFSKKFKEEHPEQVDLLIEGAKPFTPEACAQYYLAMKDRVDKTSVLKETQLPVLFIIGTEDIAAPLSDLLQQVHLPNQSHLHILEGVGHMGMLEAPDVLNKYLLEFINDVK